MKRNATVFILVATLVHSSSVWALDPQSVQAYCDEVKKAAIDAQSRYIQVYQPRVDPGRTFEEATSSCLDFISGIQIGIPSIYDGLLEKLAKELLNRACRAAQNVFDKNVNEALQSVNESVKDIPGVSVKTTNGGNAGVTVKGDGGSAIDNAATRSVDRVINFLK